MNSKLVKKKKFKEKQFKVENSPHKPSKLIAFPFDNLFVYFFLLISNKLSKINIENSQRVINTERKAALALNSHQGYRLELHAQLARIPPILSFISLINNS